jgi:hypothetical protein
LLAKHKFSDSQNTREKNARAGHLENIKTLDINLLSSIFIRMSTLKKIQDILYSSIRKNNTICYYYNLQFIRPSVNTSSIGVCPCIKDQTSLTFEGIISTAGDGRCRSLSETTGTQLVALLGTKPGKH